MAASAIERLLRVLELEQRQAHRNRAVIGGLGAMAERWGADARAEALDGELVDAIVSLMAQYDDTPQGDRADMVAVMRQVLTGDLEALSELQESSDEELLDAAADPAGALDAGGDSAAPSAPASSAARRSRPERSSGRTYSPHDLQSSPEVLAGVGSATAEQLARLGILRVVDILWHLPARHEDYSQLRTIAQLKPGEQVTLIANLWELTERKISMNRKMVQGILADGTGTLHATWWSPYVRRQLTPGATLRFSGKVGLFLGQKTLDNPAFEELDDERVATGRLAPVYPLTEGLTNKRMRGLVKQVLDGFARFLSDPLPDSLRGQYDLPELATALQQAHFPDDPASAQRALRRLAFEEFLYVQLGVLQHRQELRQATSQAMACPAELLEAFRAALPFAPTGAQERVLGEIARDMAHTTPMTRLLQGDVGSGKTAVAAGAMLVAVANGAQAALLAPTQILAEQHHRSLDRLLGAQARPDGAPVQVALLTGRVAGAERDAIAAGLQLGQVDVVIGTTALIQDYVEFSNLGLVIVDEQHRFGVEQRGALRSKGLQPHLLVMSATPIPRSLALTLYGDLDISVLDEMPPGRIPIKTKWFRPPERERLYSFIQREAGEGRQAFIVYPLVEESEKLEAGAAVEEFARLRQEIFPHLRLALLHGRMSGAEKDEVMRAFAAGEHDVLVSTSVIEVGIDVPNASLILVEDAERFGLAQLHQFRGRVGRGQHKSYCALVSDAESGEAQERLHALETIVDGFELAEKDLALRGPGDFLGKRQSGLPDLRVARLSDVATLTSARQAAQQIFAVDPALQTYPQLARQVQRYWRGQGDVS